VIAVAAIGETLLELLQPVLLTVVAVAYARRAGTLSRRGSPVPPWRMACFAAGLLMVGLAFIEPLENLAEELVLAHMVQHLLLGDAGALLLVLGLTGPMLQPILAIPWLRWIRALAQPVPAFTIWVTLLYVWHIPALYQGATFHLPVHVLQHICFAFGGFLMWMALLGPLPKPEWFGNGARAIYVIGVRLAGAVLGNWLMWSGTVLYPDYASGEAQHGISPLADQGTAGTIMMIESTIVVLASFAWLLFRWAREDTERQSLLDLAAERGVELDPARAARAAAAGEGARLRERIEAGRTG
jgi:cytochrome c oxidase assembly factor CtaG